MLNSRSISSLLYIDGSFGLGVYRGFGTKIDRLRDVKRFSYEKLKKFLILDSHVFLVVAV